MKLPLVCAALLAALPAVAHDGKNHEMPPIEGPADAYFFRLAEPGSYRLPPIKPAADARLLDAGGAPLRLSALLPGRITVLAFLYTRCADACPIAALRLADLQALASRLPEVAERLQLISLSFDPEHDTPARMAEYGRQLRQPAGPVRSGCS
ncbi:MAG: SCO family protein [Tistlia sp.]|uniref:SCO family protein n=1 Tax=Tistlia sp. TaxID=3057121 RepID=UPI0034A18415